MATRAIEQGHRQRDRADGRAGEARAVSVGDDRTGLFMLVLGLATGVEFLENAMVTLFSAHIMGGVGATPAEFVWTTAAYAVASILIILNQRWLAEAFGYRRYLTLSLLLYALGTVGCGGAGGPGALIAARFVQGLGAGALFTSCRILLQVSFTGAERTRAVRVFISCIFGTSALAPLLASVLIDTYDWNAVFYGVAPLIVLCAVLAWVAIPERSVPEREEERAERRLRYDYGPVALFAVGLVAVEVVMQEVRFEFLWSSPALLALLGVGVVAFVVFLWHQARATDPILHVRVLRDSRQFLAGLGFYFLYYLVSYSYSYLFPVYSEQALGFSVELTGRLLFVSGLVSLAGVLLYLRYSSRIPRKKLLMCGGLLCAAASTYWLSLGSPGLAAEDLYGPLLIRGLFGGLLVLPVAGLTFQEFAPETFGHAYRMKNIVRQLCNTFAVAIMAATLQHRQDAHWSNLVGSLSTVNPLFSARVHALACLLLARGVGAHDAPGLALALMARALGRQVLLLACLDAFRLLVVISLAGLAVMLWQRRLR